MFVEKPLATDADECVAAARSRRGQGATGLRLATRCSSIPRSVARWRRCAAASSATWSSVDILRGSLYPPVRGRPAAAAVPHRRLSVPRPRHPRASTSSRPSWARSRRSTRPGGRAAATEPGLQRLARAGRAARRAWGRSSSLGRAAAPAPDHHPGDEGRAAPGPVPDVPGVARPTPLPKPAERIVNALTDSIQPLIDVPRNVVAFARKQIRQYHGVQELVDRVLRGARRGTAARRSSPTTRSRRCAGPRRWRAPPTRRRAAQAREVPAVARGARTA